MSESLNPSITMAIDTKRYGFRIHKVMYKMLGSPKQIQLLVNPIEKIVAVQAVDWVATGGEIHRISEAQMRSSSSYEIYSRAFIRKLREVEPRILDGNGYRLTGSVIPSLRVAVFSLHTLRQVD